jgi:hypothetical protein
MTSLTLYQRLLGNDFYRLPPILQQFHSSQGGCATGKVTVERHAGLLRHKAADLLHLPDACDDMALHLQVIPMENKERWIRHFNQQSLETLQWQEGEYLIEKAGPLQLAFKVAADEQGLTFRMHHKYRATRKVLFLSNFVMRVNAQAHGAEDHWKLEVNISTPLLGKIATYRGEIIPQLC